MFPKLSFSKLNTYNKAIIGLALLFIFLSLLPAPKLIQTEGFSKAVYDSHGKLLRLTLSPDDRYRLWVPLAKMEQKIIDATLLYEDRHFYWHPGFNPAALLKASLFV